MHTSRYTPSTLRLPVTPALSHGLPSQGGYVQTVGALGQADPNPAGALGTAVATGIGGVLGGALIGYISSGTGEGSATGAMFAGGLAGAGDAVLFFNEGNTTAGAMVGLIGMGFLALSIYRFQESRGSSEPKTTRRWA